MRLRTKILLPWIVIGVAWSLSADGRQATIIWDTFGVPHIYAENDESLFYAFARAQMESNGDLLLRLYGEARGRAAEYWGEDELDSDRWVLTNNIPERAAQWYAQQPAAFRRCLEAFSRGVNDYAKANPTAISADARLVLPVTPVDVLAHTQRVVHFTFIANPMRVHYEAQQMPAASTGGSNAWAISGRHTASGMPMLLGNPHLPWQGMFRFYEAHLNAPGVSVYGATLIGFPVIALGFNQDVGWTHTVNTFDGEDLYELTPAPGGYMYDGVPHPFETSTRVLRIRMPNGAFRQEELRIRSSLQGPIIEERQGRPIALRVTGLEASGMCREWWEFAHAHNLKEFESSLRMLGIPTFNVIYAGRDGHILSFFGGRTPQRNLGDWSYWQAPVPGDTSRTLWTEPLPYEMLPRVIDPPSGWLQNANDPPWTTTFPEVLDPGKFPAYLAPRGPMSLRAQRSVKLIQSASNISLDDLLRLKHCMRSELADRILGQVVDAALSSGDANARLGAEVLRKWDRNFDSSSRGAALFGLFAMRLLQGQSVFADAWDANDPLNTPRQLAHPAAAAALLSAVVSDMLSTYGSLDIPLGEVERVRIADVDLPATGGPDELGIFSAVSVTPAPKARYTVVGGESFIFAVEFSNPLRARVLLTYGNSSQLGASHTADQAALFSKEELRIPWLTRETILAHSAKIESLPFNDHGPLATIQKPKP